MITSIGLKTIKGQREKKAGYVITNINMKDISNIIREFEKLPYKGYVRNITKHEPTDSYFYLARQISKCIMRSDAFNFHFDPVRT